jgi:hypothetical protein
MNEHTPRRAGQFTDSRAFVSVPYGWNGTSFRVHFRTGEVVEITATEEDYVALRDAESIGAHYNRHVRNVLPWQYVQD